MTSFLILELLSFFSQGCGTFSYLLQAGAGQISLMNRARPISDVLKDERASPHIKSLLAEVSKIKRFGEEFGLKPTNNYQDFVQLKADQPVVWVVSACEPLQFKSKEWRFPFFGSFTYLGWFDQERAKIHAQELRQEGFDVHLRGASAYSTLGWFHDPVLSSMLSGEAGAIGDLVDVILHESVHSTLYLENQSYFNESLAFFMAEKLSIIYLKNKFGENSVELNAYLEGQQEERERGQRYHEVYRVLDQLYRSHKSEDEKKNEKKKILETLAKQLKVEGEINNASLVQYRIYNVGGIGFENLLKVCGGSWSRFWDVLKKLKKESFTAAHQEDFSELLKGCF